MMKSEGFLSSTIATSHQHLKSPHGEPANDRKSALQLECLSYEINKLAMQAALTSFPIKSLSDFLTGVLFARLVQDYQAVILMTGRGMRAQSRTMARSSLESMLHCLAASEDVQLKKGRTSPVDYIDAVLSAHDSFRVKQSIHVLNSIFVSADVKAGLAKEMESVRQTRPVGINLQDLAEDLGRSDWYSRYYRNLSQDSHPSATAIDYLLVEESNEPVSAKFSQDYDAFEDTVSIAILVLCEALRSLIRNQFTPEVGEPFEAILCPLLEEFLLLTKPQAVTD